MNFGSFELTLALKAAKKAANGIREIYQHADFGVQIKEDQSPLTKADLLANDLITNMLTQTPWPVLSEETAEQFTTEERQSWPIFWLVDPLDGTKDFIDRNGEFSVNIALVERTKPVFGIIAQPVTKEIYFGGTLLNGVWKINEDQIADKPSTENQLVKPLNENQTTCLVIGSRRHASPQTMDFIDRLSKNFEVSFVQAGSALKFCKLALGQAEIYPRFAPTMEWDTAAGHAILTQLGGKILNANTLKSLTYNKDTLLNPDFIAFMHQEKFQKSIGL